MIYKLEDICDMQSGGTPKRGEALFYEGNIPWAKISDFENAINGVLFETEEYITEYGLKSINNRLFKEGTLLLAMYGSVGKTVLTGRTVSTNQAILGINPIDSNILNIKYLKYWFIHNKGFIYSQGKGATLHNISLTIVKKQKIDLPDVHTQNKIVSILDKASDLITKRERSLKLLDELLRATFLDMFGDPVFNKMGFPIDRLENLCDFITKGTTPKNNEIFEKPFDNCIPFLKVYNITDEGSIDFNYKPSFVSHKVHNQVLNRSKVKPNDILMNIVGPPLGKIGLVPSLYSEWNINQAIVIFRPKSILTPIYLLNTLRSKTLLRTITDQSVGVRQQNISLKQCRNIIIPIPPIEMQIKFDFIYNRFLKVIEQTKISANNIREMVGAILQKAFNGDLNFNIDAELDSLLNEIDLQKKENDLSKIVGDEVYLQRLIDKLNTQEFKEKDLYNKAKHGVFQLLKEDTKVTQVYNEKDKSIQLALK